MYWPAAWSQLRGPKPGLPPAAMFRIIDRYIIRELILPFLMGLVVFTFLLMIQPLADYSEQLISKGVSWQIVAKVLVTLIPQALAVTIPIALLIGLLWLVVNYLAGDKIPFMLELGAWNFAVGFAFIIVGLLMTMRWR